MKVVMLSKALVAGAYQTKLEELARLDGIDLLAIVPPSWREPKVGEMRLERRALQGCRLEVLPIVANGQHHLYFFTGLRRVLHCERPDILHIDEESFNLATFLALRAGLAEGAACCFYNWANIDRRYPPPFGWFERYTFRHAACGIAGNQEAAAILRRHGYCGPLAVLPQFGVDPELFAPAPPRAASSPSPASPASSADHPFVVGYVGRLLERKGVLDLLEAVAGMPASVRLSLVGSGSLRPQIEQRARSLGVAHRVNLSPPVSSTEVPTVLRRFDVLVLPSRTTPSWKEQFGRVLVEAMSCGLPVVGSSSGEIPNVMGDAGLVFPEGDVVALRKALERLNNDRDLCHELGQRGRERVLTHYTHAVLARKYSAIYQAMPLTGRSPGAG